jgi:SWI/SNF-related matrix-associated actin-dependent regulator 1 of chromatin subfamily A
MNNGSGSARVLTAGTTATASAVVMAAPQQLYRRQLSESAAAWATVGDASSQLLRSACLYLLSLAQASVAGAADAAALSRGGETAAAPSFQAFAVLRAMVLGAADVLKASASRTAVVATAGSPPIDAAAATATAAAAAPMSLGGGEVAAIAASVAALEKEIRGVRAALLGEDAAAVEAAVAAEAAAAAAADEAAAAAVAAAASRAAAEAAAAVEAEGGAV